MNDWDTYAKLLNEMQVRNDLDWNVMDNADRLIVKAFMLELKSFSESYVEKIEQWEAICGKVEMKMKLN